MPDYKIQAPDGNSYQITGPAGASRDEIIQRVTAKYPQAAKPKASTGPGALGIAGKVAGDIAGGTLNPKELFREAYHSVTDFAGHTIKAADDLADWLSDKTGFYQLEMDKGGIHSLSREEYKRKVGQSGSLTNTIADALLSEKLVREPQTTTGNVIKDIGEFTMGMLSAGKVFKIANKTLQGTAAAWTVFDPQQKRLSDLVAAHPSLSNPVTNYLKSDPGDSHMESRLKNALEGVGAGAAAGALFKGLDLMRSAMKGKVANEAFKLPLNERPRVRVTGTDARTGRPRVRLVDVGVQEAQVDMAAQAAAGQRPNLSAGVAQSAEEVAAETRGPRPATPRQSMEQAFSPAPLAEQAQGKLKEWWRWTKELVAPGSVSPEAKQAEADIASAYASHQQHIEERFQRSPERREFWNTNTQKIPDFVRKFERGEPLGDNDLERARTFYKNWMTTVQRNEVRAGVKYEAEDHYMPHLFEDQKGVQEWLRGQGARQAGFAQDRTFDLYEQAVRAGFKPRFTNPEEIFQARQHASDVALAKIDSLKKLAQDGLAIEGPEGKEAFKTSYSTPDGKTYWVHDDAKMLLNRMFDERSLWSDRSPIGSVYRGMVALKNNLIPIRLAFSLFHPLHVLSMHMLAAAATRSYKAGEWMPSKYSEGSRMLQMLRGQIPNHELTQFDKESLQYVGEGGLILEQDPRYRTQALEKLRTDFQNANPGALLHVHTGALQAIQNLVFKTWIPSLKGASYLADVRAAIKAQPNLVDDGAARRVALRRIAKSVENRYGEMNYSTLFWNRTFRDVSVLSATSMGWQLGLFREYGGGAGQLAQGLGKIAMNPKNAKQIYNALKTSGDLDKLMYIANYTTIAATLGGLTTWALTGKRPTEWLDYFAPKTGEQNPDGRPSRVRTMFYPYEFAAVGTRVAHEGPGKAAKEWIAAKGTGIPSMLAETWTGIDSLGREIRDPNGTIAEQARQTLNAILRENEPISLQQRSGLPETTQQRVLDFAGMSKAPKYLQETSGEAQIQDLWQRHYKAAETPFSKSVKSAERQKLREAIKAGDDKQVDASMGKMAQEFNLRSQDAKRILRDEAQGVTSYQALFRQMTEEDQRAVLRKMPKEERVKYVQFAKHKVQAEFSE